MGNVPPQKLAEHSLAQFGPLQVSEVARTGWKKEARNRIKSGNQCDGGLAWRSKGGTGNVPPHQPAEHLLAQFSPEHVAEEAEV